MPATQRQRWWRLFFEPEVQALNSTMQSIHNIATWQRCAVAQVGLLFEREEDVKKDDAK